jgi:hypothetical protein
MVLCPYNNILLSSQGRESHSYYPFQRMNAATKMAHTIEPRLARKIGIYVMGLARKIRLELGARMLRDSRLG